MRGPNTQLRRVRIYGLSRMLIGMGKYMIAGALYRRAIFLAESVSNCQERYFFLKQILDDQAALLRKIKCGHPAF